MGLVLMALVMVGLIGTLPAWPYSRRWSFVPSGVFGLVLLIVLVLMWFGVMGPELRVRD